ncbi:MAG: hypothetical protein JNK05_13515 [Myxococcales bacterium]|nr:hypothetical protein [Myxococcales bacterium]
MERPAPTKTTAGSGAAPIRLGADAFVRLFLFATLTGGPVGLLATAGITASVMNWRTRLATNNLQAYASASERDPAILALVPLVTLVVLVIPVLCLALRRGRRTRVTWDEAGITEWEGDSVRTFIARATARVASEVNVRTSKQGSRVSTQTVSHVVQVSDAHGRRITVAWRDPRYRLGFGSRPLWMRRRPVLTKLEAVEELLATFAPSVARLAIEPDERSTRRPLASLATALNLLGFGLCGLSLYSINTNNGAREQSGLLLIIAGLLFAAAVLRPIGECIAVARVAKRVADAQKASFDVTPQGVVLVTLSDGRALPADSSKLVHADSHVHRRAGAVRAVVEVIESSDVYRGEPARAVVHAVDTEVERAERRRILIANALEIAARLAHVCLLLTIGALIFTRIQQF